MTLIPKNPFLPLPFPAKLEQLEKKRAANLFFNAVLFLLLSLVILNTMGFLGIKKKINR
jgi:hypothetical protein